MAHNRLHRIMARRHKGAILAVCFAAIAVVMIMTSTILFMVQLDASSTDRMKVQYATARQIRKIGNDFVAGNLKESYDGYACVVETTVDDSEQFLTVTRKNSDGTDSGVIVLRVTVKPETNETGGTTREVLLWDTTVVAPPDTETESDTGAS